MIVTAALAWYREEPAWLERCVRSLAPLCDRLVAVDGRWDLFPETWEGASAEEQRAVKDAAHECGLAAEIYAPLGNFSSQVAKRDYLMAAAGEGADWLLVIDGDEHLDPLTPDAAQQARDALAVADRDVAELLLVAMNQSWPYSELPTNPIRARRFYRAGTRCPGPAHNIYALEGRFLNGDPSFVRREPALDLSALVTLQHDNQNRGAARTAAAKEYRRSRQRGRVEAWIT